MDLTGVYNYAKAALYGAGAQVIVNSLPDNAVSEYTIRFITDLNKQLADNAPQLPVEMEQQSDLKIAAESLNITTDDLRKLVLELLFRKYKIN